MPQISVKEVTPATWSDFEALFESKGAPGYCWCMAWRAKGDEVKRTDRASRKQAMKDRIESNTPVGLLAYLDGEPAAWCSVAPSTTYRKLRDDAEPSEDVWSIVCFYVRRQHRGSGIAKKLLQEALRHSKERGAKFVEAYPVDETSPSYRYMGFVSMYTEAGFEEVARAGTRRHVVRLQVG